MSETVETQESSNSFSFDFTTGRHDHSVIPMIMWTCFLFFLVSVPTLWLFKWLGWESMNTIHEWMFHTFSVDPGKVASQPWLLISYMFMHGGILHFGMNMLVLHIFYKSAKEFFPGRTWLIIYFAGGIAGGLLYTYFNEPGSLMVGASGGVMAMWGAAIAARIRYRFIPKDERPWQCNLTLNVLLLYLVIQAAMEFLIPNVAHSAHAGGMVIGFIVGMVLPLWQQPQLMSNNPDFFQRDTELVKKRGQRFVSRVTLSPTEEFDKDRDVLVVEHDHVNWLGRRSHWYEPVFGTMDGVDPYDLKVVASARQVEEEPVEDFYLRTMKEAGQPVDVAKEAEKEKSSQRSSSRFSVGYIITLAGYLILANLEIPREMLIYMMLIGAMGTTASWFYILTESFGAGKVKALAIAVVLIGGCSLAAYHLDYIETVARLLVAVAAGTILPRIIFAKKS